MSLAQQQMPSELQIGGTGMIYPAIFGVPMTNPFAGRNRRALRLSCLLAYDRRDGTDATPAGLSATPHETEGGMP
jgi:hypothetical protein